MGIRNAASSTGAFGRFLSAFGVFLLGYMLVVVGRPVALAMRAAAEAAAVRAQSAMQPAKVVMDIGSISTEDLERALERRKQQQSTAAATIPKVQEQSTITRVELPRSTEQLPQSEKQGPQSGLPQPQTASAMVASEGFENQKADGPIFNSHTDFDKLAGSLFPPNQAPPVDPSRHRLSKDVVQKIAKHNMVMVTWANFHYLDFTINWVYHIKKLGITNYIVGAMDDRLLNELVHRDINTFSMQSGLSENDFGWGSPTFHKMGREKINLIGTFTDMGIDLLLSDVDTVWSRDPTPYILRYAEADVLTSSDHLSNTVDNESLEKWPNAASAANIGIMFFRASAEGARELAREWSKALDNNPQYWDQNAFNDLFRKGPHPGEKKHLFRGFNQKIKIGIFPVSIFCSGHTYFVQKIADRLNMVPYVVHATFQFSGTPGKRHRFREALMWVDPPEYFDRPGGYISFDMDIPKDLLRNSKPHPSSIKKEGTVGHFKLVHHQILQIRNAFAIGLLLNRAVIIPQLWCGIDRWWAPHGGTIPGSNFKLPFPCPLDHVLDLEQMIRPLPHLNPSKLEWREHSFLKNPRVPKHVLDSRLEVSICPKGDISEDCENSDRLVHDQGGKVKLANDLNSDALLRALQTFEDKKIIHFSTMLGAFGGHSSESDATQFEERTKHYTSLWCCSNAHPGHIWYDMWFDKIPHRDRHNRQISGEWKPMTGP